MSGGSPSRPVADGLEGNRGFSAGWQNASHSTEFCAPLDRDPVLYAFQRDVLERIDAEIAAGRWRICLVGPTGAGKTVIAAAKIANAVAQRDRFVFAAHRRELTELCAVGVDHGIVQAGFPSRLSAHAQVCSIQTLHARALRTRTIELPPADLLFIGIEYRLPRTPIKETERRAKHFEERFGEGGTELDALEARHPGLLRQIVLDEVERYWNEEHDNAVALACAGIERQFRDITAAAHAAHRGEIEVLKADWQRILADIRAWTARAKPTWLAIADRLEQNQPIICDIDWIPPFDADEDPDPLFDSTRSYVEQIDRYKRHQGKPTSRRRSVNGNAP